MQQPHRSISVEEYLLIDNNSRETKYEYLDGYARAMVGGTFNHARIAGNMYYQLRLALGDDTECAPYIADMRTKLANEKYCYPDVVVSCDRSDHGTNVQLESPRLIVEVLSPDSTALYDRTRKLAYYQATPSIQEIMLISQDVQFVEVYRRPEYGEQWLFKQYKPGETIVVESLDVEIAVSDLYYKLAVPIEVEIEDKK